MPPPTSSRTSARRGPAAAAVRPSTAAQARTVGLALEVTALWLHPAPSGQGDAGQGRGVSEGAEGGSEGAEGVGDYAREGVRQGGITGGEGVWKRRREYDREGMW